MVDLGTESSTKVIQLSRESINSLIQLLKFILERNERKISRELKKQQLSQIKTEETKALLARKRGYVNMKDLMRSGDKLYPIKQAFSQAELARFSRMAKIYGVQFAAISNETSLHKIKEVKEEIKLLSKDKNLSNEDMKKIDELKKELIKLKECQNDKIIIFKEKDIEILNDIVNRMNRETILLDIEQELNEYGKKGVENLTEEEKRNYRKAEYDKKMLLSNEYNGYNTNSNNLIISSLSVGNEVLEKMDLDIALAKTADRMYANSSCYICSRTEPDICIEVVAKQEISEEGSAFIKTKYKINTQIGQQDSKEFWHARFIHYTDVKGENTCGENHWKNIKKEIKENYNFSEGVLIFPNKETYLGYKEKIEQAREKIMPKENVISYEAEINSYKDYAGIINNLKEQLAEHNIIRNERKEVCNAASGDVIKMEASMTDYEKIKVAEMKNIGKQISLYEKLNDNQTEIAMIQNQIEGNKEILELENNQELRKVQEDLEKQASKLQVNEIFVREELEKLQTERVQYASIGIVEYIQAENKYEEFSIAKEKDFEHEKEFKVGKNMNKEFTNYEKMGHTQSMKEWSMQTSKEINVADMGEKMKDMRLSVERS